MNFPEVEIKFKTLLLSCVLEHFLGKAVYFILHHYGGGGANIISTNAGI